MALTIEEVADICGDYMNRIARYFKPGAEVTLIVRMPGKPEQDFMLTNDEPNELRTFLDRRFGTQDRGDG